MNGENQARALVLRVVAEIWNGSDMELWLINGSLDNVFQLGAEMLPPLQETGEQ